MSCKDEDIAKLPPTLYFEYLLRHARDEDFAERLIDFMEQHPHFVYYFLSGGVDFLNVVLSYIETRKNKSPESIGRLIQVIDNKTDGELMSIIQRWQDEAKLQGESIGVLRGFEQGKVEGKAEGEKLGEHKKAVATAKELLMMGLGVDKIARATKLSVEEIKALQDELKGNKH